MPQRKIIKTELKLEDTVITKTVIYTEKVKKKDPLILMILIFRLQEVYHLRME